MGNRHRLIEDGLQLKMSNEVTNMIADGCDTTLEDFAEDRDQTAGREKIQDWSSSGDRFLFLLSFRKPSFLYVMIISSLDHRMTVK